MAIKIVKRGTNPDDHIYGGSCGHCKTEIEFKRSDAEYHSDQRDGDYLSVPCPVCGRSITVSVEHGRKR